MFHSAPLHCIPYLELQVDGVVRLLNLHPLLQGDHPYEGGRLFLGGSLEDRPGWCRILDKTTLFVSADASAVSLFVNRGTALDIFLLE